MDFDNVNPLNAQLNILSGNFLPMTRHNKPYPIAWRIYGAVTWLIEVTDLIAMIMSLIFLPLERALQELAIVFVVMTEVFFLFTRMYTHRDLASRLIQKLNDILCVKNEIMNSIVRTIVKPVKVPLKFYLLSGTMSLTIWYSFSFTPLFKKKYFYYDDYRMPAVFSKEPFSREVFLLGNLIGFIANVYLFIKKVALDVYTINFLLLITAQYRYISVKLETILCGEISQNQHNDIRKKYYSLDLWAQTEIKALCRHYNAVIRMLPMLKKLLSLNFSVIYLTNVFRFCFLGIMFVSAPPSTTTMIEGLMVLIYMSGNLVQLYILCSCVHQLLRSSVEVTDKAFHKKWYQFGPTLRSTFLLMVIGNNLECKLSTFENFNLSLPSFMTILNQSYSIALLFLRMK